MSTKAVATTYTTGQTLYWYPLSRSLADWATYRTVATESGSPNTGRYVATLDTDDCDTSIDADCVFHLFVGSSQPSDFNQSIAYVSALEGGLSTSTINNLTAIKQKTDLIGSARGTVPVRYTGTGLQLYIGETQTVVISTSADYSAKTLVVEFDFKGTQVASIADGSITKATSSLTFSIPSAVTLSPRTLDYAIRDTSTSEVLIYGKCVVDYLPLS